MKQYLNRGQLGLFKPQPSEYATAKNTSTNTATSGVDTVIQLDTTIVESGMTVDLSAETITTRNNGWVVFTGSAEYTAWGGTTQYRGMYFSNFGRQMQESKYTRSGVNGYSVCHLEYDVPTAVATLFRANQFSGATRTIQNANIGVARLRGIPLLAASARASAGQSYTSGTSAAHALATLERDDGGFWSSGANTKLTVPADGAGWYVIAASTSWASSTLKRATWIRLNGTTELGRVNALANAGTTQPACSALYYLAAGDYVECMALENSGTISTVNTNGPHGRLAVARVSADTGACIQRTTTQSIAATTNAAGSFDTVVRDDGGFADLAGNPTRLTVPTGKGGIYLVSASAFWTGLSGGDRHLRLRVNGTTVYSQFTVSAEANLTDPAMTTAHVIKLADGDYVEAMLENTHSAASTTQANLLFLSLAMIDS